MSLFRSLRLSVALVLVQLLVPFALAQAAPGERPTPRSSERVEERSGEALDSARLEDRVSLSDLERIGRTRADFSPRSRDEGSLESHALRGGLLGRARLAGIEHVAGQAFESQATLAENRSVELSDFKGKTYLEAMMATNGIKSSLDADQQAPFKIAGKDRVHEMAEQFDPTVYAKLEKLFKKGRDGFDELLDELEGQKANPGTISAKIAKVLESKKLLKDPKKVGLAAVSLSPLLSLASGAGSAIHLNADNVVINIGYKPGSTDRETLAKHVKSGRSFGVSPGHKALDASDVYYLDELEEYLDKSEDHEPFFRTLMEVLTSSDASRLSKLTQDGQTVATDFIAVYTAELDRNIMSSLKSHPWQNDLAEVTMLSVYGADTGKVMKDGELVDGQARDWFGVGNNGTGIGVMRKDRRKLQLAVTNAERKLHPEDVEKIDALIGTEEGDDVFHGLMVYLNDPKNAREIRKNAEALTDAVVEFLAQVRADSKKITKAIK